MLKYKIVKLTARKLPSRVLLLRVLLGATLIGGNSVMAESFPSKELKSICDRYAELAKIQGHFQGGEWDDKVDKWNGEKHQLLVKMADLLKMDPTSFRHFKATCVAPHRQVQTKNSDGTPTKMGVKWSWQQKVELATDYAIYEWRGQRDFLVIATNGDVIVGAGWVNAWE